MTTRSTLCSVCALLMLCLMPLPVSAATTLKIASVAPDGSLWMREMRAAAEQVAARTEGRVAFRFYPGGVMGDDATVLRKIRLGQLHGGAFTGSELTPVYRDAQIYSLPFLFSSQAEVDAVRTRVDPLLRAGFEEAGFHVVGISGVGFAYLMGSREVGNREQLRAAKVWVPQNDRIAERVFRAGEVDPVPLALGDVFTALQTGMVDTVANTTSGAIALQWHTRISHLFDLPLTYVVGYVAIDAKAMSRVDASDRAAVDAAFAAAAARIDASNRIADAQAREVLLGQGVTAHAAAHEEIAFWKGVGAEVTDRLLKDGDIGAEMMDAVRAALESARSAR